MTCGKKIETLWPVPSDHVELARKTVKIDITATTFGLSGTFKNLQYWSEAWQKFLSMQHNKIRTAQETKKGLPVVVNVQTESNDMTFNSDTYEGYDLTIFHDGELIQVNIKVQNFYGARHALETVSQLIVFDDIEESLVILSKAAIENKPKLNGIM